jgi:hypothetical protein
MHHHKHYVAFWVALIISVLLFGQYALGSAKTPNDTPARSITRSDIASLPTFTVTVPYTTSHNEFLFLTANNGPIGVHHAYILDSNAQPVYALRVPDGKIVMDFKKQKVGEKEYLSYSVGNFTNPGHGKGKFYVMDNTYTVLSEWDTGNGTQSDFHDFQLLQNGNALMMAYHQTPYDLSFYGGRKDGQVIDFVIQEVTPQKQVVFEWRALNHVPLTDSYSPLNEDIVDYVHGNSVELDRDGNLLISLRNTFQVLKINRATGAVMWVLGGKRNQFNFVNDTGFSDQHDIRRLSNGNITLWDNGDARNPKYARAVEYQIDETTKVITKTWEFRNSPDYQSRHSGNAQRLPNGNTLMSWGGGDRVTEVTQNGQKTFEATFATRTGPYRAYRFSWKAEPLTLPDLVIVPESSNAATLYFSWNGATEIAQYRVLAGKTPTQLNLIRTVAKNGFETSLSLSDIPNDQCFYQVLPIDKLGTAKRGSNVVFRMNASCDLGALRRIYMPMIYKD